MSLPRTTIAGTAHTQTADFSSLNTASTRDRARAYLARLPVSVQGQGGHDAAFRAACVLVNGFALGEQEARLDILLVRRHSFSAPWACAPAKRQWQYQQAP